MEYEVIVSSNCFDKSSWFSLETLLRASSDVILENERSETGTVSTLNNRRSLASRALLVALAFKHGV